MSAIFPRIAAGVTAAVLAVGIFSTGASAAGPPSPDPRTGAVYNSIPADPPASHPSFGFTATSTRQIGDLIELDGTARELQSVTIGMNSWACETGGGTSCITTPGATFSEAITVHFYAPGDAGAVGAELDSFSKTFAIPFRPSADVANCGSGTTKWHSDSKGTCQNGMTVPVTFDLSDSNLDLPDQVIVSVTYPTSRFGELASGPWDSLNLDTVSSAPSVGSDVDPDVLYVDSEWDQMYDGGATGVFRATGGETGYALNIRIDAKPSTAIANVGSVLGDFENKASIVNGVTVHHLDGTMPAAGCYYGVAPVTNYATHDSDGYVVTHYAGYANTFPDGGYTASADFYVDADAAQGQFTWSHAVNGTDDNHRRDFVFVAGTSGDGSWTVGATNNVATSGDTGYGSDPIHIATSGWYTFQHTLYAGDDGLLYVDMAVLDASGHQVGSWTLGGQASDRIPNVVGGNRYGWLVTNSFANLPIDNVLLGAERPTAGCTPFLDVSSVHGPKYNPHASAVAWMGLTGQAKGWKVLGGKDFRPAANTSRAAMAEFLYRAAGSPTVALTQSPFGDMSKNPSSKFYNPHWKAILWMYENGYTHGIMTKTGLQYGTLKPVTRGEVAAFMFRIAGSPTVSVPSGAFTDVSSNPASPNFSRFAKEIQWLHDTGLANGWNIGSGSEYRPDSLISRSAIAAFFYRAEFSADA